MPTVTNKSIFWGKADIWISMYFCDNFKGLGFIIQLGIHNLLQTLWADDVNDHSRDSPIYKGQFMTHCPFGLSPTNCSFQ